MANHSWIVVCIAALALTSAVQAANVRKDIERISPVGPDGKNASSSMYFQQLFSKEASGATETKLGPGQTASKPKAPMAAHPTSIQAVNSTANAGNLTSSETQNYYGYEPTGWIHGYVPLMPTHNAHPIRHNEPTGINKRHVHYPPVPMDVINSEESANDDGDDDYADEGDNDDADYDDDEGQNSPRDGGGEDRDDVEDFAAASFAIPKIDPNHAGCKTVYKEVQSVPGKVKSVEDDDDGDDFSFRRRRKRSAAGSATSAAAADAAAAARPAATNAKYIIATPSALPQSQPSSVPIPSAASAGPEAGKPKVTAGESRFVPINADPWRAPRGARGIGGYGGPSRFAGRKAAPYLAADDAMKHADFGNVFNNDDKSNTKHFHKYPYPHFHIYYNRPGMSALNEKQTAKAKAVEPESDSNDSGEQQYESPNTYFEFTNPQGNESNDDDEDDGEGDNSEGDQGDEDVGLAASPTEGKHSRARRGTRGRYSNHAAGMSPSETRRGVKHDDSYGWAMTGPNFYKSGKYQDGDGKKKPKKYSYNFYTRDNNPKDSDLDDSPPEDTDSSIRAKSGFGHFAAPKKNRGQGRAHSHKTTIHHAPPKNAKRAALMSDPGDYNINYGHGTFENFDQDYDSDRDGNKNQQHDDGGHQGGGHGGDDQEQDDGQYHGDDQEDEDDF